MSFPSPTRLLDILTRPITAWPEIAREQISLRALYTGWILWLVAVPSIASAVSLALFYQGVDSMHYMPGFTSIYMGIVICELITGYLLQVAFVAALSWWINALSLWFHGQSDLVQATKSVAYAMTPAWLAGVLALFADTATLASAFALVILMASLYSLYLLYLALPFTMQCPAKKATPYVLVVAVTAIVLQGMVGTAAGWTH